MVFLNKNREKGLKAKKKIQNLLEKKPSTDNKTQTPQTPPSQQQPNIQRTLSSPQTKTEQQQQPILSSSPWWISDVIFVVEGRKIPAHKVVLGSRSNFFARMQADSPQEFQVTDYSYHIFSQYMKWIYGGTKEILPADASELCRCAFQFESQELVNLCEKIILENQEHPQILIQSQEPSLIQTQHQQLEVPIQVGFVSNDQIVTTMLSGEIGGEMFSNDYSYDTNPNSVDEHFDDVEMDVQLEIATFGMNTWSNDPVLFAPEHSWEDVIPVMEIC